tara:strand:- start:1205 stop:1690 length:486 start_codon:yes stop_codon:yes gene_type:complete
MTTQKPMTLVEKLHFITHSLEDIQQGKTKGVPYKITSWNEVNDKVKKELHKNRVLILPRVLEHTKEGNLTLVKMNAEIINVDMPEDKIIIGDYTGHGIDQSDKGFGKACSYAYKYLLMKLFMTSIGTEEDSEFSNPEVKAPKQKQTTAQVIDDNIGGLDLD